MFILIFLLLFVINLKSLINPSEILTYFNLPILCDFEKFKNGCEDLEGSFCEESNSTCLCKPEYPIRMYKYCLKPKKIGEACYTSRQCETIENAACYIFGKEYDKTGDHNVWLPLSDWPIGTCKCKINHQIDVSNNTCIKRVIGSWCSDDRDCIKETLHSQCKLRIGSHLSFCECSWGYFYDPLTDTCNQPLFGSKCTNNHDCAQENLVCFMGRCKCPEGTHLNKQNALATSNCVPNDNSSCDHGYRWDDEKERCVLIIHSTKPKNVENTDDKDKSISYEKIIIIVIFNVVAIGLVVKYCYYKKGDDLNLGEVNLADPGVIRANEILKFPRYYPQIERYLPTIDEYNVNENNLDERIDENGQVVKIGESFDQIKEEPEKEKAEEERKEEAKVDKEGETTEKVDENEEVKDEKKDVKDCDSFIVDSIDNQFNFGSLNTPNECNDLEKDTCENNEE